MPRVGRGHPTERMKYHLTTVITEEADWFVARAIELGVVSQGKTVEEAEANLKEAVALYLEDADVPKEKLIAKTAPLVTSFEIDYA